LVKLGLQLRQGLSGPSLGVFAVYTAKKAYRGVIDRIVADRDIAEERLAFDREIFDNERGAT
jgi:hypothetical protein